MAAAELPEEETNEDASVWVYRTSPHAIVAEKTQQIGVMVEMRMRDYDSEQSLQNLVTLLRPKQLV